MDRSLTKLRLLKRRDVTPPDWYRFRDPDTGHETRALTYYDWVEKAREHRQANNLAIPHDFEAQMQDQICATIPPEYCQFQKEGSAWVNLRLSLGDIVTVTKSLIASAVGNYVSQEEAERRAEICSRCYLNVRAPGCGACHQLVDLIAPDRSTSRDKDLENCGVCSCYLKPKVHIPIDLLQSSLTDSRQQLYPSFCWLRKDGDNYVESN